MGDFELYNTLNVPYDADLDTIKSAYRKLVKHYHPDSGLGDREGLDKVVYAYKALRVRKERKKIYEFPLKNQKSTRAPGTASTASKPQNSILSMGEMLLSSKMPGMRVFAARALGNSGQKSVYSFLRRGLNDADEQVILACIEAVGKLKILQSAQEFSCLYQTGSYIVRKTILDAILEISQPAMFHSVLSLATQDRSVLLRHKAEDLEKRKKTG